MPVIGKLATDGTTETEADVCAITGRPVLGQHSIKQQIKGTTYYYRYLSDFQRLLTDDKRAEIEALVQTYEATVDMAAEGEDKTVVSVVPTPRRGKAQSSENEIVSKEANEVEKE